MNLTSLRKPWLFLLATFVACWTLALTYAFMGGRWQTPSALVVATVYMFIPAIMAIVVQKGIYHQPLRGPLGVHFRLNRWYLLAWLLPVVITLGAFGMSLLLPGVRYSPGMEGMFERFGHLLNEQQIAQMREQLAAMPIHPLWMTLLQGLLAGATINAVAGFGEELGWRGMLHREFSRMGFWPASFLIGAIWGIWHAPLILQGHNFPFHPVPGVALMTLWCVLASPLFTFVRIKTGSVLGAAVMHGTINGTAGLAMVMVAGGSDLTVGLTGIAGIGVLVILDMVLWGYLKYAGRGVYERYQGGG